MKASKLDKYTKSVNYTGVPTVAAMIFEGQILMEGEVEMVLTLAARSLFPR